MRKNCKMGILLRGDIKNVAMSLRVIKAVSDGKTLKEYLKSLSEMPKGERDCHCSAVAKIGRQIRELRTENVYYGRTYNG